MKKIIILLLSAGLTIACGGILAPVPTPKPEPTITNTATLLPSSTPVTPTLTFTLTPTLVGIKTPTPALDASPTVVVSVTPLALLTPSTPTPTFQLDGFLSVITSLNEFYKAGVCEPSVVRITAQVVDYNGAAYVLLFVRFKSMTAERYGKWTKIDMETIGAGTYFHDLSTAEMREDAYFQTAWIEYQIVATRKTGVEIARTGIYKEKLKMLECVPTATPTSANVKP
ncbi:MAG: hypothetical protein HXY38_07705 [Chloroflexi bacterium]|nr:hypothetical protein [Chloroflexota bacterium]